MKTKVYKDASGLWRWQLKARNGEIVAASSESFTRRAAAVENIRLTHSGLGKYLAGLKQPEK